MSIVSNYPVQVYGTFFTPTQMQLNVSTLEDQQKRLDAKSYKSEKERRYLIENNQMRREWIKSNTK